MSSAFGAIAAMEIRTSLRRISTWVYFGVFFLLSYLFMLVLAGTWSAVSAAIGTGGRVVANSPYSLTGLYSIISLVGVIITAAVVGNSVCRDFEVGIDPLFFTTPVSKLAFLGGRFTGAMVVNALMLLGICLGAAIATAMPWVSSDKIGAFRLAAYLQPYVTHVIPNLLLTGAIFFALAAMTRQMVPNYIGGVVLLLGYLLAGNVFNDIGDKTLSAMVDPFGLRATAIVTEYWSIAERNSRILSLDRLLLWNRLLWLGVAAGILAIAVHNFRFAHAAAERKPKRRTIGDPAAAHALAPVRVLDLPAVTPRFDARTRLTQFRSVALRAFWRIVANRYFGVIVGAGLLYLVLAANAAGQLYGTTTWPVTYQMVEVIGGSFWLFIVVIVAFYSGELVWAERDARLHQVYDATPVTDAVTLLAKLTAITAVIACLLALSVVAGIVTQVSEGYYRFEPLLYAQFFAMRFVELVLLTVLAMTVHVLVNQKYVGHLVVVLTYLFFSLLSVFGLDHNLYQYGSGGGEQYSDMNGFGPFLRPFLIWKSYWLAFAALLVIASIAFWIRGLESHPRWRVELAKLRFGRAMRVASAVAALAFIGLGGFIFYNTNVRNEYRSQKEIRASRAERERLYKKYERVPQPRIVATNVRVDLYPQRQDLTASGSYVLRNGTMSPIDSVHVALPRDMDVRVLRFDRPSTIAHADEKHRYYIHRLATPLAPNDSVRLEFELAYVTRGFENRVTNTSIVANGSFVSNELFMPKIGYDPHYEIADDDERKKAKLPPRPRMPPPTAPGARAWNYVSHDADWLRYAATVCTDSGQLALTSGYLQREWTENGRRCFAYAMDAPILDLWAVQSARYAVARGKWRDVKIEVYYHRTHDYNVQRMIEAVQKSLAYFSEHFGPYQHRQLRIVEFPRYAQFAQSLPNTIPYSENIGFIARLENPDDVDYPFYVTAHEVAHQWWAHQVIGADAQGSTLLSETLAQYSALMVMEQEFGAAAMRRFLQYELDRYLIGRATEREREMPIVLGENQPYIHYNKGSLVMYALRDYLGDDRTNAIVRGFLERWKFKGPPYPTSMDFVAAVRDATPDSLAYIVADLFEHITLYELKADSSSATQLPDSTWRVNLWVTARKLRADSLGRETEVSMNDWIDIGVYGAAPRGTRAPDKNGVPLYLVKHRIKPGAQQLQVIVGSRPRSAGIDPLHKLVDRRTNDNVVFARQREARASRSRSASQADSSGRR